MKSFLGKEITIHPHSGWFFFEVEFTILENELKTIYTGQKVLVATFTNPDKKYPGYITEINPTVDENGQIKVLRTESM